MSVNIKNKIKAGNNRTFLTKDFESFRQQMIENARIYFPDKINDFSEPSVGGLLVDLASTVGDTLSFYLDHQFKELDYTQAVENDNIINHLRTAGVEIMGSSPASVMLDFSIVVPSEVMSNGTYAPKESALPVILSGAIIKSLGGVTFNTIEDINFAEKNSNGDYIATVEVAGLDSNGNIVNFKMIRSVMAVSGEEVTETFAIPDSYEPFREIVLTNTNVHTVLSVMDSDGNEYYEVNSLSNDTVFKAIENSSYDKDLVKNNLEVINAPRRFIKITSPVTFLTTLRFGGGDASILDDDIIPNPSELSLELYGKTKFSRFSIDPNSLLKTKTLGISPKNTTLTVRYRSGGGISHNAASNTIKTLINYEIEFRGDVNQSDGLSVKQSITCNNPNSASGGQNAPSLEALRTRIPNARNSQNRVVTREDLLSRIYTLPSIFGRVYRAGITNSELNNYTSLLFLACLDNEEHLTNAPDTLKLNLSKYLNEFRLLSESIDILDAQILNFGVKFTVIVSQKYHKKQVVLNVESRLANILDKKYFQINQPLVIDDIVNVIINTDGVLSLVDLKVYPLFGNIEDRFYTTSSFNFESSIKNGIIYGPNGSIFELKYPDIDIIGYAS